MTQCSGFDDFFAQTTGNDPFPWQQRLAVSELFPKGVAVPTGCGKTAGVILAWNWRQEYTRLVYVLPSRALVDQVYQEASEYAQRSPLPFKVFMLKGGVIESEWALSPDRPAIIVGTQDQILSRVLNRGYASSPFRWPVDFGLLNNDSFFVFDEPQAMGAGLDTGIAMQFIRSQIGTLKPTGSLWLSATLPESRLSV